MNKTNDAPRRYWMLVGWLTLFLVGTDLFVVAPFLPMIASEMHVQPSSLTFMVSIFGITYAIASPLQGRLAERMGVSRILFFGITMLALGNLLTALSHNIPSLLASRAIAGFGAASTTPMLYALTANHAAKDRRSSALAILGSGLLIALAMGAPVGLLLGGVSNWRNTFFLLAIAFAIFLPINGATWRVTTRNVKTSVAANSELSGDETLSQSLPYLVAMIFWAFSVYAIYTMLGTALKTDYQLGVSTIAGCLATFGVGATMGSLMGGHLADRLGPERMTILAFAAMVVGVGLMELVYLSHNAIELAITLFVFALCSYAFFPSLQACVAHRFVIRRPTVLALLSSSLYVGITFGAAVGGWVYSSDGMRGVIALALIPSFAGMLIMRSISIRSAITATK